jgi:hypothetical protein
MGIAHDKVLVAVEAIAASRQDGAVFVLEAGSESLKRLHECGASDEHVAEIILRASRIAASTLPTTEWARTGWSRFESALPGQRDELADFARTLVARLLHDPDSGRLSWRTILTRIFPGEALRTMHCDPGYDLAEATGSFVAWVDPYPGDDWRESQRYPTTTFLWQRHRAATAQLGRSRGLSLETL